MRFISSKDLPNPNPEELKQAKKPSMKMGLLFKDPNEQLLLKELLLQELLLKELLSKELLRALQGFYRGFMFGRFTELLLRLDTTAKAC